MYYRFKERLIFYCGIFFSVAIGTLLALYLLRNHLSFYFNPSDLIRLSIDGSTIRIGGIVKVGSIIQESTKKCIFMITDGNKDIIVEYQGVLPAIFREGQGVVVKGHLKTEKIFIASEVLVKHDENYRPPNKINYNSN